MPTLTFHPSAVLEDMCSVQSVDSSHPYSTIIGKGTDSSEYAQWYMVTGGSARTKVYYSFDLSAIPADAIITSVICKGKCQSQNDSIVRGGNTTLSLYSGTTEMAKTANKAFGTSAKIVELPQVSWTREQLTDCRILIQAARGRLNTNTSYYIRCFGIDLIVTYEIPVYYTVTTTINGGTLKSPTTENMTVLSGDDCEITFNGNDEYIYSSMTVNGISVSPTTKTESGREYYSYTISAVDSDKTVVIIFNQPHYVKVKGKWKKVLTAYRKINGAWEEFDYTYDNSLQLKYLGHITSDIVGEITTDYHIVITDTSVPNDTYYFYYEDANKTKLTDWDVIGSTEFNEYNGGTTTTGEEVGVINEDNSISLTGTSLATGTYTMYYENADGAKLEGWDSIGTISK